MLEILKNLVVGGLVAALSLALLVVLIYAISMAVTHGINTIAGIVLGGVMLIGCWGIGASIRDGGKPRPTPEAKERT